jgi:hypothetical protein
MSSQRKKVARETPAIALAERQLSFEMPSMRRRYAAGIDDHDVPGEPRDNHRLALQLLDDAG